MVLTIINECNRACPYCFQGEFTRRPRRMMSAADVDRLCRFFALGRPGGPASVSLLGGETTLHPELFELADVIRGYAPEMVIFLLTNLTCDLEMTREMVRRDLRLLVNVAPASNNTTAQQEAVARNLAYLADEARVYYSLAVTITAPDEPFDYLYDILQRDGARYVRSLRLGFSSPGLDFSNVFVKEMLPEYGEKYREVAIRAHQINPRMLLTNECAVNLCLFSSPAFRELSGVVKEFHLECSAPNMDVLPDFSTHWCFAFQNVPEMRIANIFECRDVAHLRHELWLRMLRLLATVEPMCEHRTCARISCTGPCPAHNYYRKYVASE